MPRGLRPEGCRGKTFPADHSAATLPCDSPVLPWNPCTCCPFCFAPLSGLFLLMSLWGAAFDPSSVSFVSPLRENSPCLKEPLHLIILYLRPLGWLLLLSIQSLVFVHVALITICNFLILCNDLMIRAFLLFSPVSSMKTDMDCIFTIKCPCLAQNLAYTGR